MLCVLVDGPEDGAEINPSPGVQRYYTLYLPSPPSLLDLPKYHNSPIPFVPLKKHVYERSSTNPYRFYYKGIDS
jgi:hypothetical protein